MKKKEDTVLYRGLSIAKMEELEERLTALETNKEQDILTLLHVMNTKTRKGSGRFEESISE